VNPQIIANLFQKHSIELAAMFEAPMFPRDAVRRRDDILEVCLRV
jgi:hypothetical protein